MVETVELVAAEPAHRPTIENLLQLYLHDFSAFAPIGSPYGEVGPDGRFGYEHLDLYWSDPGRWPFLIMADGRIAGFVLATDRWSPAGRSGTRAVAEFFVLRKYRRAGVGKRAAVALFARHPGTWEVPVAWYNEPALAFWRAAIVHAVERPATEIAGDGVAWAGPILMAEVT